MIELLDEPQRTDGAAPSFERVLERIGEVRERLEIHMYVWRNDAIGNQIGKAVLEAAERGVEIKIRKDAGALMYERIEMNRKSFFPEALSTKLRIQYSLMGKTFPDTFIEDDRDWELGKALLAHPRVEIERVHHTHSKYYLFDEETLITGSINIEDRHRGYRDYMVEICGAEIVRRFRDRLQGEVPFDAGRSLDFLVNEVGRFEIKPVLLELLAGVREKLYIEMAYIGDLDINQAIVEAAKRGVDVTVLFSRKANIGNDNNYHTLIKIWKQCELRVFLSDQMIHSKLMMFDEETVMTGSANVSIFSMQKAVELDIVVRDDPGFLAAVKRAVTHRCGAGHLVERYQDLDGYSRSLATLQDLHQKIIG
ncbi:MAG: cardiolipin synthase [Verrucomicrobiales bacterium]|jgi:cardiolipin synthase